MSFRRGGGPQGGLERQEEIWCVPHEEVKLSGHSAGAGEAQGTKCQETFTAGPVLPEASGPRSPS